MDYMPGAEHYRSILHPDQFDLGPDERAAYKNSVHEPFETLMARWLPLNKALDEGRVPAALLKQAAFVSGGMPDMSKPSQVRHYGHLMDLINEGLDPTSPSDEHLNEFVKRANEGRVPNWNKTFYELNTPSSKAKDIEDIPQVASLRSLGEKHKILSRLAHVHRTNGAAPEWVQNGISRYALSLIGSGNSPIYDHIGKASDEDHSHTDGHMSNHPALGYVLDKYQDHFKDKPDQALLPATFLHRLVSPHHDKAMNGHGYSNDHQKEFWKDIANTMQKHGIHPDMAKSEYPASLPGRVLQATEEVRQKHGPVAALMAYHLHGVPALLGSDGSSALLKMETTVSILRKNSETFEKAPKVVHFQGKAVIPGMAQTNNKSFHLFGQNDTHYFGAAEGEGIVKLPKDKENTHFKIVKPPIDISDTKLDADAHGVNLFNTTPEQRALIHNADLSNWQVETPKHSKEASGDDRNFWVKAPNGKIAYVKQSVDDDNAGVNNEAIYHNLARDFFGLGNHVPLTAVFDHPANGRRYTIHEGVDGAEHFTKTPWYDDRRANPKFLKRHQKIMDSLNESGDLDKIALMDAIMGSSDRHQENYVFSKNGLHLIDNERLFHSPQYVRRSPLDHLPHYWDAYHREEDGINDELHPEAVKWALGLNSKELESQLRKYGASTPYSRQDNRDVPSDTASRLRSLQGLLRGWDGRVTRGKAFIAARTNTWDDDKERD